MQPRFGFIILTLAMGVATFLVPATSQAASPNRPNTLFILTGDQNPDTLGGFGGKGTCYDGGARTPCFLWGKGRVPAGRVCDKLVQNIDFAPTIFDLAGIQPPAAMRLDGMSLMPLVMQPQTKRRAAPFLEIGRPRAVCTERWKYIARGTARTVERLVDRV